MGRKTVVVVVVVVVCDLYFDIQVWSDICTIRLLFSLDVFVELDDDLLLVLLL